MPETRNNNGFKSNGRGPGHPNLMSLEPKGRKEFSPPTRVTDNSLMFQSSQNHPKKDFIIQTKKKVKLKPIKKKVSKKMNMTLKNAGNSGLDHKVSKQSIL